MTDYDFMMAMLERSKIIYSTDWSRQTLLGDETRVVRFIIVSNKTDGQIFETIFKFSNIGELENISTLTVD